MRILLIVLQIIILSKVALAKVTDATCRPFYQALTQVPHESIFQRDGVYSSQWFGTGATGCFLVMNTSETRLGQQKLPDLSGAPGTPFYDAGWRVNLKYSADGPGTGVVGLEKGDALCLVYKEQPAYLDDNGEIIQDEFIKIMVECLEGMQGQRPRLILRAAR